MTGFTETKKILVSIISHKKKRVNWIIFMVFISSVYESSSLGKVNFHFLTGHF
jgi:hypothetical protein